MSMNFDNDKNQILKKGVDWIDTEKVHTQSGYVLFLADTRIAFSHFLL